MDADYQCVRFERDPIDCTQRPVWQVFDRRLGEHLGAVAWFSPERRYCFGPSVTGVLCADRLREIAEFVAKLDGERWPPARWCGLKSCGR